MSIYPVKSKAWAHERIAQLEAENAALKHMDALYDDVCRALPMEAGAEEEAADVVKRIVADRTALRQEREALKDRGDLWQKAAESYMADLALARAVLRDASEVLGDIEVTMTTEDEYALVEVLRAAWQRWQKARRD